MQNYYGYRAIDESDPEDFEIESVQAGDIDWRNEGDVVAPIRNQK